MQCLKVFHGAAVITVGPFATRDDAAMWAYCYLDGEAIEVYAAGHYDEMPEFSPDEYVDRYAK